MTEHEWLISQKLAKPGRGRRSAAAKNALAAARKNGVVFSDKPVAKHTAAVRAKPIEAARPVRSQTVMWGIDKGSKPNQTNIIIAFTDCLCGKTVSTCKCIGGPRLPKFIGGGFGLLVKPGENK